jgi:syntaxin 16
MLIETDSMVSSQFNTIYLFILVTKLEGMHRKHLLPGFDDRTSDEAAIENLTQEITNVKLYSIAETSTY